MSAAFNGTTMTRVRAGVAKLYSSAIRINGSVFYSKLPIARQAMLGTGLAERWYLNPSCASGVCPDR